MIGHTESTVLRSKLGIVELHFGGQGTRNQDERKLGSQVVELLSPLGHRDHSYNGEGGHAPSHLIYGTPPRSPKRAYSLETTANYTDAVPVSELGGTQVYVIVGYDWSIVGK